MQQNILLENLASKITGILYYSESENPLTIEQWGPLPVAEVTGKIAAQHQVEPNVIKPISPADFFNEVERAPDPNDAPIVENAQRFKALHQFLNEHFTGIQVIRVENGTSIPVYIVCHQPDGTCVALATTAIES
ncbi:nuclease A inhibitor family protein [Chitinophaga sp. 212800010-3]|uniref:nuclease A inhibitor family protein n=1 Tax=unclassified Chitinophaga TaxID=2619133 RepID=UPI002DF601F4|nr:Nuclease A inhibitor-like protein [Chitinophaga sp. 212800010-3]